MKIYKNKNFFRKCISIMLTMIIICSIIGNTGVTEVKADGETPVIYFHYDDRGTNRNYAVISGEPNLDSCQVFAWTTFGIGYEFQDGGYLIPGNKYTLNFCAPEGRNIQDNIVEIRIHYSDKPDDILSNVDFFDGENEQKANLGIKFDRNWAEIEFTVPSDNCSGIDVYIWWSEYDRCFSECTWDENGEITAINAYCLEVCNDGSGEAYLDGISKYRCVWEYMECDNEGKEISHWGGQKILIDSSLFDDTSGEGPVLKFRPYDDSCFDEYTIHISDTNNQKKTAADFTQEEPSYKLNKEDFNETGYLNMDVRYAQKPSIIINYDRNNGGKVEVSGAGIEGRTEITDAFMGYSYNNTYTFILTPPENRKENFKPIIEVRIHHSNSSDTVYANFPFHDDALDTDKDPNLNLSQDNSFTVTVPSKENFCGIDINIAWSDYDRVSSWSHMDENNQIIIDGYCIEVLNGENGDAGVTEHNPESDDHVWGWNWEFSRKDSDNQDYYYGNQKFTISASDFLDDGETIQFNPHENCTLKQVKLNGKEQDKIINASELGENLTLIVKRDDFNEWGCLYIEPIYEVSTDPGQNDPDPGQNDPDPGHNDPDPGQNDPVEPGHDGEAFKQLIESKKYAFGDWDRDGEVDADDLKLGMAQMIYYPEFNSNAGNSFKQQHNYPEVTGVDYLMSLITLTESSSDNLEVSYRGGVLKLPAYKYKVSFTDPEDASRSFTAEGIGYLFSFDESISSNEEYKVYSEHSNQNVIMYANGNGQTKYFLRNNYGEEGKPSDDCLDPVTGNPSGEGAFCAVADYDNGSQYNEYGRNVGIFGNGASLDNFIMSDPSETDFITLQGRNEDFARDTGHTDSTIFGKFSFYKPCFTGMKIQGCRQNGNTPAWSFATDPIWGSATDVNTDKEAVVYFGNSDVCFKPVKVNNYVKKIKGFEKVDSRISDPAVMVVPSDEYVMVYFNSNFYDMVEFKVIYDTEEGDKTEYIWLHRVGIDINEGHINAGESILHHGTENGPGINLSESYESFIYATYYYPEFEGTDELVDLYATYTWKDGSVTKELIRNDSSLNLEFHHKDTVNETDETSDLQSSDFILYKGTKSDAPVKVEVSAVKVGSDDTQFSGMRFGSGRGVCWESDID